MTEDDRRFCEILKRGNVESTRGSARQLKQTDNGWRLEDDPAGFDASRDRGGLEHELARSNRR